MPMELTVCSRRRSRHARRWTLNAAAGLVTLLVLAFALPSAFGLSRCTVSDDAMSGTMERGSAVFAKSLPVSELEIGDVITYARPSAPGDQLITRRIADIDAGVIWTRSDSTGAIDPWTITSEHATQALAVAEVPYVGYAYDAVSGSARVLWRSVSELH